MDVPFFLLYMIDRDGRFARLVTQSGLEPGTHVNPELIDLQADGANLWLVANAARAGVPQQIDGVTCLAGMSVGPYPEVPTMALALPILPPGSDKATAVMVAGVSSRSAMNEPYRHFYDQLAAAIAAALANAGAYDSEWKQAGALQRYGRAVLLELNIYRLPNGQEFIPCRPTGTLAGRQHLYALVTSEQYLKGKRGSVYVRSDGRVFDYSVDSHDPGGDLFDTGYTIYDLERTGRYAPVPPRRRGRKKSQPAKARRAAAAG